VITRIYSSNKDVFRFALEDIYRQTVEDVCFPGFDFIIFSLSPRYPSEDVNLQIERVFGIGSDSFLAFHSLKNIMNQDVVEGVTACFLKLEGKGRVSSFMVEDISEFGTDGLIGEVAAFLNRNSKNLNIFIAGLCGGEFPFFLDRLNRNLKGECRNVFGGVSSGFKAGKTLLTYQFHKDRVIRNGFVILSFENFDFEPGIALGFEPVGPIYEVTESDGLRVYSIDGNPAVYLVERLLDGIEPKDIRYLWYAPVVILDDDEGYVSVLRTFKDYRKGEGRFVEFYAPIYKGQKFRLSFATPDMLVASVKREAFKIKRRMKVPDLVFDFSCVARQSILGEEGRRELRACSEILDAPIFGFFTYGEIGPDRMFKKLKLYNETSIIVALREEQ